MYCDACLDSFKSYYTHITSFQHQFKLSQNTYYTEIDSFIEDLNKERSNNNQMLLDYYNK